MSERIAAVIGATGMIGSYLIDLLTGDPYFDEVRLIVRRPMVVSHPKLVVKLVDFNDFESLKLAIDGSDALFCAIGTTQQKVKGDKELYRKIDFDIPVRAARCCKETGCRKFMLVSSIGADKSSGTFYLRLKGEVEDAIAAINPGSFHIMQPSMLLGDRKEKRFGEQVAKIPMLLISPLLGGSLARYRSIEGRDVAAAMLECSKSEKDGIFRYTYREIREMAAK